MSETVTIGRAADPSAFFAPAPAKVESDVYLEIQPTRAPYNHQRQGANAAVRALEADGYFALFMEMGTGKTKTTLDSCMVLAARGKIEGLVVVVPKGIVSTWIEEELAKNLSIPYSVYKWDGRTNDKSEREFNDAAAPSSGGAPRFCVFVVNVEAFQRVNDTMVRRLKAFIATRKVLVVVDESSFIKGHDAIRSKKIVGLGKLVPYRMILTGTEIVNSPLDLYMQMKFLNASFWGSMTYFIFRARYAILIDEYGSGGKIHKKVTGFQRMPELMDRVKPHCFRALKKDCLDLPEEIFQDIVVELTPAQEKVYASLKSSLAAMIGDTLVTVANKMALFTKFRQVTGGSIITESGIQVVEAKPQKLEALLAELEDTDEQAIIWCSFTHEADMLMGALAPLGLAVAFHGDVPDKIREKNKAMFQAGEARFFVANPAAAGFGLNLQNCHLDYTYSPVLSPAQVWQAWARNHRPGQTEKVVHKRLAVKNTVDQRVWALLEQKADIREKFQGMSIEEIINLV